MKKLTEEQRNRIRDMVHREYTTTPTDMVDIWYGVIVAYMKLNTIDDIKRFVNIDAGGSIAYQKMKFIIELEDKGVLNLDKGQRDEILSWIDVFEDSYISTMDEG